MNLYSEIDEEGWELRKVDEYRDGQIDRADRNEASGITIVSDQRIPSLAEINKEEPFKAEPISPTDFEAVWHRAGL